MNVALEEPAGIATLAGTVAAPVLLLERVTVMFAAATPVKVTVPVELVPPITLVGLRESVESDGALIESVAARLVPLARAEIDDVVLTVTGTVVTVSVAVRLPAATLIAAGT